MANGLSESKLIGHEPENSVSPRHWATGDSRPPTANYAESGTGLNALSPRRCRHQVRNFQSISLPPLCQSGNRAGAAGC